jgi:hypothetical protein
LNNFENTLTEGGQPSGLEITWIAVNSALSSCWQQPGTWNKDTASNFKLKISDYVIKRLAQVVVCTLFVARHAWSIFQKLSCCFFQIEVIGFLFFCCFFFLYSLIKYKIYVIFYVCLLIFLNLIVFSLKGTILYYFSSIILFRFSSIVDKHVQLFGFVNGRKKS